LIESTELSKFVGNVDRRRLAYALQTFLDFRDTVALLAACADAVGRSVLSGTRELPGGRRDATG
jgi:hypothetical protein